MRECFKQSNKCEIPQSSVVFIQTWVRGFQEQNCWLLWSIFIEFLPILGPYRNPEGNPKVSKLTKITSRGHFRQTNPPGVPNVPAIFIQIWLFVDTSNC